MIERKNLKIVFMGTPDYADRILKRLLDEKEMDVAAVFTQPDRPVGRKKVLMPPPVKVTALEAGIEVHQPESLKAEGVAETIEGYAPDFIVVAAYGQLLPKAILDIAPCINLHASLLPKYRGASPIQEALLHGDKVTGVTAMRMEEGLDSGPVLAWRVREIWPMTRKNELFETLADDAADLTPRVLEIFTALRRCLSATRRRVIAKRSKRATDWLHSKWRRRRSTTDFGPMKGGRGFSFKAV